MNWIDLYFSLLFLCGALSGLYVASEVYLLRDGLLRQSMLISKIFFSIGCFLWLFFSHGYINTRQIWFTPIWWVVVIGFYIEAVQLSYNRRKAHRFREKRTIKTKGLIEATYELSTGLFSNFAGDPYSVFGGYTYGDILSKYQGSWIDFINDVIHPKDQNAMNEAWEQVISGQYVARMIEYRAYGKDKTISWVQQVMISVKDTYGHIVALDIACESITDLKTVEEELKTRNTRLISLLKLSQLNVNYKELVEFALEECVRLTHSKIGYFHLVKGDNVILYTWSKEVEKMCSLIPEQTLKLDVCGIWADPARIKKPVIHNDYKAMNRPPLPEGHIDLTRHMSLPIIYQGNVVAIIGVGNKETEYTQKDQDQLELYSSELWEILFRKEIEEQAAKQRQLIQAILDNCPDMLWAQDIEGRYLFINYRLGTSQLQTSAQDAIGRTDREIFEQRYPIIPQEERDKWNQLIDRWEKSDQEALSQGIYHKEEHYILDDKSFICEVKKSTVQWHGKVIGLVGWLRNQTGMQSIIHTKNMLSTAINHIQLGVILYSIDTTIILFANHHQGIHYKQPCHTLIGQTPKIFYPKICIVPEFTDPPSTIVCLVQDVYGTIRPVKLLYTKEMSLISGDVIIRIEENITKAIFHELFGHYKISKDPEFAILLVKDQVPIYVNKTFTALTGYQLDSINLSFLNLDFDEIEDDMLFLSEITTTTGDIKKQLWRAFKSVQGMLLLGTDLL